jgi:signal peptidase II
VGLFLVLAVVGLTADLLTKQWIFDRLGMPGGRILWVVEDWFGFQTSLNEGALFGIAQGKVAWLAALSFIALAAILYWLFLQGGSKDRVLLCTLACVGAGILGNLFDRLGLHGLTKGGDAVYAVRDWIVFRYGDFQWPNFNVADSLLVCGAIILSWRLFWIDRKPPANRDGRAASREG